MKVVINACFGGFGLSRKAIEMYCEVRGIKPGKWDDTWSFYTNITDRDIQRDDPTLVDIVEKLGEEANGSFAKLKIVDVPDDADWQIEEYDGKEWIAEVHKTWS